MSASSLDVLTVVTGAREAAILGSSHHPERRGRIRLNVRWRLLVRTRAGGSLETLTENLSSSGLYFLCPEPFPAGETLLSILSAPAHDPGAEERTLPLACRLKVMRLEPTGDGLFGVACRIEDYQLGGSGLRS